jgi:hypothetical protein
MRAAVVVADSVTALDARHLDTVIVSGSHGIAAGAVDYRTARIGDARSMESQRVLSCVNDRLAACAVRAGMSLPEAVARVRPAT